MLARLDFALAPDSLAGASFWHRPGVDDWGRWPWRSHLLALLDKWRGRIKFGAAEKALGLEEYMSRVRKAVQSLPEPDCPTLLHGDYTFWNLLLDRGKGNLLGVIDFGNGTIGDSLYDLAKMTWADLSDEQLQGQFCAAWEVAAREAIDYERLAVYHAIEVIGAVAWVDKQPEPAAEDLRFRQQALEVVARTSTS